LINAISTEFPLLTNFSNRRPIKRASSPCNVKQFPEQRSGNNRECPTFLQLPSLQDNKHTYLNTFIEQSREIERNIVNNAPMSRIEELSKDNIKKLNQHVHRHGINVSKSLDKSSSPDKIYFEKLNISPKYLKNLNDYKISENYNIDKERQLKLERKSLNMFDCLNDQLTEVKPDTLNVDKWSKFYENYLTLSESSNGFRFQKGYFTDFADHQKVTLDLKKFIFMDKLDKLQKEKKEMANTNINSNTNNTNQRKVNKRYVSFNKAKTENAKKKTLEVLDKNRLYKIKSYLIKNGVLS